MVRSLLLPCGRCVFCVGQRAREWSVRVMHEAQLYDVENCFVTLTYADEYRPANDSLAYEDFQKFLKRYRKLLPFKPLRYFACGEYGEKFERPHFHAALFNCSFRFDRKPWRKSRDGFQVYRSKFLEHLWPFGMSEIGDLTQQSAAYIARYALKKVNGDLAAGHYADHETGELRAPECLHMSTKPGIGAEWYARFPGDVHIHDRVVVNGKITRVPRYYDKILSRLDEHKLEQFKMARDAAAREHWRDNTPERLSVKERVEEARIAFFKRSID